MFIPGEESGRMIAAATDRLLRVQFANKKAAKCEACKADVPVGAGFSWNAGNWNWKTVCASTACAERANVRLPDNRRRMTKEGFVYTPKEPQNLELLRSLPGARWDRGECAWQFSLDMADRVRVLEIGDQLKLEIDAELREIKYDRKVTGRIEAAKTAGPWGEFQVAGVEFLAKYGRCILADDMGLGKTWQALQFLPENSRAILVVPKNVKFNWKKEIERFRPEFTTRIIQGRQKVTSAILPKTNEIVIINYDILPADLTPKPSGRKSKSGKDIMETQLPKTVESNLRNVVVIADEIHRVKNYKAQRSKKFRGLSLGAGCAIGMTGSPLPNRPLDLWGVLQALGLAHKVFGSFNRFMSLFGGVKGRFGIEWPDFRDRPVPAEVAERLRRVMLRRTKAEVLPELPGKTYKTIVVDSLTKAIRAELDVLAERWGEVLDCGELPDFEEFSEIRAKLAKSRIPAVLDIVSDYEDAEEPLVVFSAHRAPIEALEAREGWGAIHGDVSDSDRADIVQRFQAGELKGIALTIAAGCEGLTLTRASHMLFVDQAWLPGLNEQAEDRICRIGQLANAINIIKMVSDHPLDLRVLDLLADKQAMIRSTLEARAEVTISESVSEGPEVRQESADEMQARLDVNQAAEDARLAESAEAQRLADEEAWLEKVEKIRQRQLERASGVGHDLGSRTLSPVIIDALKRAYEYMLAVCDGAVEKDGVGFNKPDACMARVLMHHDLDSEPTQRALWAILIRYRRQLGAEYPVIFMKQ